MENCSSRPPKPYHLYIEIDHNSDRPGAGQDDVTESSNFTVFVFTPFLTSGDRETMSTNNFENILGTLVLFISDT